MEATDPKEARPISQSSLSLSAKTKSISASSPPPKLPTKGHAQTEVPTEPDQIHDAFNKPIADPLAIGNPHLELALKLSHQMGTFLKRSKKSPLAVQVPIDIGALREGAQRTLKEVIRRALTVKGYIESVDIDTRSTTLSVTLSHGIAVAIYLKLRSINQTDSETQQRFLKTPKVPTPFKVPTPYALAISQLGVFKVSSLTESKTLMPTTAAAVPNYGLPANLKWSQTLYTQAQEYAESIGLGFTAVDNTVKLGSSWWLYEQEEEEDVFSLNCILPEDNYTETTAVLHTLFCSGVNGSLSNSFTTLTGVSTGTYGTMLRNPPADINLSSYYAVDAMPEQVWKVV